MFFSILLYYLGAIRSGIIVVNTNPLYTPDEMKHQFKDSGCKAIFILSNFALTLKVIIADIEHVIVSDMGDMFGVQKGTLVNFVVSMLRRWFQVILLIIFILFKRMLYLRVNYAHIIRLRVESNDIAFLQYMSGTTGVSKGATCCLTKNVISNVIEFHFGWIFCLRRKERNCDYSIPTVSYFCFCL